MRDLFRKNAFLLFIPVIFLAGCITTRFTITDEMVKPILDRAIPEMQYNIENGVPIAVWWCDDERQQKEPDELIKSSSIAYWIQGYLEQEFVKSKKYDVVTRTQLDKIFQEQQFQMSGYVSDETIRSVGMILGARYMIVPRITPYNTLNIQVLDSESGKIMYLLDSPVKEKQRIGSK